MKVNDLHAIRPYMTTQQVEHAIRQLAGNTVFSVVFRKRSDGKLRHMVCRLGVRKGVNGSGARYNPSSKGLLTVYDFQKRGWRMVPLDAIQQVKIRGQQYILNRKA